MDLGLTGMKAIVTGGTKGIGRAVAEHLAAEGVDVAICARNAEEVAQTVTTLSGAGVRATGRALDVADGPALKRWIEDVGAEFGGIDIVVSNVSALAIGQDEASWQAEFSTDMMGTVRAVDAAMPFLESSEVGIDRGDRVGVRSGSRFCRRTVRCVQSGADSLREGSVVSVGGKEHPGQRAVAGQYVFPRRRVGKNRAR